MTRWWERRAAVGLAAVLATVPLWFVTLPPLIDLLGHMGRYHVQLNLADNPVLRANWDFRWHLIGNLGGDLLMEPLGRLFGVERGAVILGALLLIVMITGMARLARAAHGHLPATAWAAFPFALAYPWQYGLVNYWLGAGLALHAAATFRTARPFWQLGLVSLLLWVVHIYGWAIFAVLMAARAVAGQPARHWVRCGLALWPIALPLLPMLILGYGSRGASETYGWFLWSRKLDALLFTLRDQHKLLDLGSLGLAAAMIAVAVASRRFRLDPALMWAATLFLIVALVVPYQALGSAFADGRLWPIVFIVALLGIRPAANAPVRLPQGIAAAAAIVFAVRIAATTVGFQAYDAAYARHLAALDQVPRGSRIAIFLHFPCQVEWRRPRLDRIDSMAVVRRDAFTNGQWDVPGAQLLTPLGAKGTRFNADPSQLVRRLDCPADLRPVLARRIAQFPRDRFAFVWVIGFRPETLPRFAGLTPLFADDATILYRIEQ